MYNSTQRTTCVNTPTTIILITNRIGKYVDVYTLHVYCMA